MIDITKLYFYCNIVHEKLFGVRERGSRRMTQDDLEAGPEKKVKYKLELEQVHGQAWQLFVPDFLGL